MRKTSEKLPGVSVLALNYNDAESSAVCLSSLIENMVDYPGPYEIFLIDNGSTDDSVSVLKKKFPKVKFISYEDNLQGPKAFTKAMKRHVKYDLVYITPNDMEVTSGFLKPLVKYFKGSDVFCVNPTAESKKENESYRRNVASRRIGLFRMNRERSNNPAYSFSPTMLGVFDKKKFLELGGPDPVYHPTFYDDYDLGYRAWKRGWRIIYEPSSVVKHNHTALWQKVMKDWITIDLRNKQFFVWKNYDNLSLLFYFVYFPLIMFLSLLKYRLTYLKALGMALKKLPEIIGKRRQEEHERKFSDNEIFQMVSDGP